MSERYVRIQDCAGTGHIEPWDHGPNCGCHGWGWVPIGEPIELTEDDKHKNLTPKDWVPGTGRVIVKHRRLVGPWEPVE